MLSKVRTRVVLGVIWALSTGIVIAPGCDWQSEARTHTIGHGVWMMIVYENRGEVSRLIIGRKPSGESRGGHMCPQGNEYVLLGDWWYYAPPGDLVLIDTRTDRLSVVESVATRVKSQFYEQCRGSPEDVTRALVRLGTTLDDLDASRMVEQMVLERLPDAQDERGQPGIPAHKYRSSD